MAHPHTLPSRSTHSTAVSSTRMMVCRGSGLSTVWVALRPDIQIQLRGAREGPWLWTP